MPAGPEFENFAAVIWGIIFVVGGSAMWLFFFHILHEQLYTDKERESKKNKAKTHLVLAVIVIVFFILLLGNHS
jgi:uncharacterized membrane protein